MLIKILRKIINSLVWFFGLAIAHRRHKNNIIIPKLGIIRTDAIGDFVLFSPALKYIRQKYENFQIALILQDRIAELAENCPYIDIIIAFNIKNYRKNLFYKFSFLLKLFQEKFDICLYPVYSRERIGDEMVLWTCAPKKIGWDTKNPNMTILEKKRGDKIYKEIFKSNFTQQDQEIERNKEFLKYLKIQIDSFSPEIWTTEREKKQVQNLLESKGLDQKNLIGIIPGAIEQYRKWGTYKFKLLMKKISLINKNIFFIIIGSSNDRNTFNFAENDAISSNAIDLCGKTNLKELSVLFEKCNIVVGNETGPLHMAITIGVPTVCVLGGGQFGRFMPYGDPKKNKFVYKKMKCFNCNWRCIYPTVRCITEISVDDVFRQVKKLLPEDYKQKSI